MRRVAINIDLSWAFQHHHGVFAGVQQYAQERGDWDCVVSPQLDESFRHPGAKWRYDGVIARVTPQLAARAKKAGVPLVNVHAQTSAKGVPTAAPDRQAEGSMAAEHLLSRGLRHFAYLGRQRDVNSRLQLAGYRRTLKRAGFDCDVHLTRLNYERKNSTWQEFHIGLDRWIDSWMSPIGVFVSFDLTCRYLADVCRRKGINIPMDAALVGSQNEPAICLAPEPSLTSIDVGYERVGFEAARLLDSMMDGNPPPPEPIILAPKALVPRRSTDAYAVDDPLVWQAMRFIAEQGHTGIRVDDVARATSTTRRTLERKFRSALGRTVAEELTRLRIERIKRQLVETGTSVGAVAEESGFIDAKQMSKTFTRVVGVSPREYRRQRRPK